MMLLRLNICFVDASGLEEKGEGAASKGSGIEQEGESTLCTCVVFSLLLPD
jgi:hypothetical protein